MRRSTELSAIRRAEWPEERTCIGLRILRIGGQAAFDKHLRFLPLLPCRGAGVICYMGGMMHGFLLRYQVTE